MQAIETVYKGYRFRSRLEARYAVFFDALNIDWDYETEGYDLGEYGYYLPDFWFSTFMCFGEVKPVKLTEAEYIKACSLEYPCLIFDGKPSARYFALASSSMNITYQEYLNEDTNLFYYIDIKQSEWKQRPWHEFIDTFDPCCGWREEYLNAAMQAKQARFEHGQIGAPSKWAR